MDSLLLVTTSSPFKGGFSFINFSNNNSSSSFKLKNSSPRLTVKNSSKPISSSYLVPLFQKLRDFAAKSSNRKWGETECLQSGAFGAALMSATATAKVKISPLMATLAANPTFVSGLCGWAVAQSIKVFLNYCVERRWDFRVMFASGGMPSSHSALCTALTTSVAICHGVADSLFPVSLGFTLIVMYDAIGVRRHAGMQAQVLNLIIEDLFQGHPISQRKLKELLGHTLSQVFVGALLGVLVASVCCQICLPPP